MGATITCKYCNNDFAKNQLLAHQANCKKITLNKQALKKCEVCEKAFTMKDYYQHLLSHYENVCSKEKNDLPTVSFCDYNFSTNKIKRISRVSDNYTLSRIDRKDYSNIDLAEYLKNLSISNQEKQNGLVAVDEELLKLMSSKLVSKTSEIKDKTCAICMKDYEVQDRVLTTPCSHDYHHSCIIDWFRKNNSCPICKFKIVKENLVLKPVKNK